MPRGCWTKTAPTPNLKPTPNPPSQLLPKMSLNDVLFLVMRWLHNLAAVAWVGGGIYYLLIVRPRLRRSPETQDEPTPGRDFLSLVNTAFGVLLVTGVVLTFHRVTSGFIGVPYVAVLAAKVFLAFCMFYLVRFLPNRKRKERQTKSRSWLPAVSSATAVVLIGVVILLLADVLSSLFEQGLRG